MADPLTPDGVRARRFDLARRGYERTQVEAFLDDVAARLAELEGVLADADPVDPALGLDDPEALARELHRVGADVGAILEAAREAAEGMRTRAAADSEALTSEAAAEAAVTLDGAVEQSQIARSSAWDEGTALLESAAAEVAAMIETAKEESLFVRAEAEREALRLTGDAKRDRDEAIRSARAEAETIVEQARSESGAVLTAANQQAELAQERARALEDRRAELLTELEAARASITDMEEEIESKRQELEAPPEPAETELERTHHTDDGGSVRIVAPSAVVPLRPVDAEELVAEVEALRAAPTDAAAPTVETADPDPAATGAVPSEDPASGPTVIPAPVPDEIVSEPEAAQPQPAQPEPAQPELAQPEPAEPAQPEPVLEAATDGEPEPVTASTDSGDRAEDPPGDHAPSIDTPDEATSDDTIGSLFAQLRSASTEVPSESVPDVLHETAAETAAPADSTSESAEIASTTSAQPEMASEGADLSGTTLAPSSPAESEVTQVLPLQNEALRTIKRSLVELQNETLEHLRTDDAWMPDESFTDRFRPTFAALTEGITGTAADAEGAAFGTDLFDAVSSAIERSRSSGAGDRAVAAAASKVFRMWRSDEAERRVMEIAGAPA